MKQRRKKRRQTIGCPLVDGLDAFGGKWKSRIVCVLFNQGTLRFAAIRDQIKISDPALSAALKEMLADGLLVRTNYNEVPPRVDYSLTEKGRSAWPILQSIGAWTRDHAADADKPPSCEHCPEKPAEPH